MKKNRSTLEWKPKASDMETPVGVSVTVPDDSYTVSELLKKHSQGLALNIQKLGQFDDLGDDEYDSEDMNQFQNLDLAERKEKADKARRHIDNVKEAQKKAKKASEEPKKPNLDPETK